MSASEALPYQVVDVFTDNAFAGNPLAVVFDADELSTAALQALAREFNLSETAFPMAVSPDGAGADYRLRIFTPSVELPFAGHPSVGAAWAMRSAARLAGDSTKVLQECGAGLLPLEFDGSLIRLTGGAFTIGPLLDVDAALAAVGLLASDLSVGTPRWCGAGIDFAFLPVLPSSLERCVPDLALVAELGGAGLSVFAWDAELSVADTRVFAGGAGVLEDPATGSAAIAFGAWLASNYLVAADGPSPYLIRQGFQMGRPSLLHCNVDVASGEPISGSVAGSVVPIASGTIRRPDL